AGRVALLRLRDPTHQGKETIVPPIGPWRFDLLHPVLPWRSSRRSRDSPASSPEGWSLPRARLPWRFRRRFIEGRSFFRRRQIGAGRAQVAQHLERARTVVAQDAAEFVPYFRRIGTGDLVHQSAAFCALPHAMRRVAIRKKLA